MGTKKINITLPTTKQYPTHILSVQMDSRKRLRTVPQEYGWGWSGQRLLHNLRGPCQLQRWPAAGQGDSREERGLRCARWGWSSGAVFRGSVPEGADLGTILRGLHPPGCGGRREDVRRWAVVCWAGMSRRRANRREGPSIAWLPVHTVRRSGSIAEELRSTVWAIRKGTNKIPLVWSGPWYLWID